MSQHIVSDELLARCADILGTEELSLDDDFFGVGGNSLDAVELSGLLSKEFGREVTVDDILQSGSFDELFRSLRA
ncbi:acyl carrier protein [Catellatospora sichuanensis]|uniref:acyl carrier protein n=1 Tax=Catellatospora sichuanensis TaxID=1969805 RepID=UPI0011835D75|nr:acyl carrier protein [Catellatospora sichuanensis]